MLEVLLPLNSLLNYHFQHYVQELQLLTIIDLIEDISLVCSRLFEGRRRIRGILCRGLREDQQQRSEEAHSVHLREEAVDGEQRCAHAQDSARHE